MPEEAPDLSKMSKDELIQVLRNNVKAWNEYRQEWHDFLPDLSGANLNRVNLSKAYLGEADLSDAFLIEAILKDTDLGHADLSRALLNNADMRSAILNGTNMRGADLRNANLSHASLQRADLREAGLGWVDLRGADLCEADMDGVHVRHTTKVSEETQVVDTKVQRRTAQVLEFNGLSKAQIMDMKLVDDVAELRFAFGGVWKVLHLATIALWLLPYVLFLAQLLGHHLQME